MLLPDPPIIPTFNIPTGPERGITCLVPKANMRCGKCPVKPPYGSLTYDREKGEMLEWPNEDEFLAWLAAEEQGKAIQLIVSRTEESDSPNWRARCEFRCSRELSGGKTDREKKLNFDRKIPSKKTGCKCRLIIKQYPNTEVILGKYMGEHDHLLGGDNLRFLRLSHKVRNLVMDMVCTGMGCQAIVSKESIVSLPSQRSGYCTDKMRVRILQANRSRLLYNHAQRHLPPSDCGRRQDPSRRQRRDLD
jgi:hypothetical protein